VQVKPWRLAVRAAPGKFKAVPLLILLFKSRQPDKLFNIFFRCCFDADKFCNTENWLSAILESKRTDDPATFFPNYYHPCDYTFGDSFAPEV
jgi:hypothetical protein